MPHFLRVAFVVIGLALSGAAARAADLAIDQAVLSPGDGRKITFKNITLKDCNLSRDEALKLFTGALPGEDAGAMLERMAASRIDISEAELLSEDGGRFTFHGVVAEDVEHGGAKRLSFAALDGVAPDDSGDSLLHASALQVEHVSMPGLAAAMRGKDLAFAAIRFSHLSFEGGELSVVDKGTPAGAPGGNRILIRAGQATIDQNFNADGAPLDDKASFTGFSLIMPPQSRGGAALKAFGYPELTADIRIAGAYDPDAKIFQLKTYAIDINNVGRLAFSGQFSGVEKVVFDGEKDAREKALLDANVDWAQVDVSNAGLFDKVVAYVSLSQGKTPDAVRGEWRAIVSQTPLLFAGAPAIAVAAQAVEKFIADPKSLVLRVKAKDKPLRLGDLAHIEDPAAFLNRLEVSGSPVSPAPAKSAPGERL
jgi:hypothetical protein